MRNLYLEDKNGSFVNIGLNGNRSVVRISRGYDTTITGEYELKLTREQKKRLKEVKTIEDYADFYYNVTGGYYY